MSRGHSFDLRERVIALFEGGVSRRAAARQLLFSESSAINWFRRFKETRSFAEKPGKKARPSPLDANAEWLLALVAREPDLTLAEIESRLLDELHCKTTDSSIARFFQRHKLSYKKRCTPASSTGKTWPRRAKNGKRRNWRLIRTNWFLSMKQAQTPR
jgi:transposase